MRTHYKKHPKALDHMIDNVFNRSISEIMGTDFITTQPSVNILDNQDNYQIALAAPGLTKSDFNIKLDKNELRVSALKAAEELQEDVKYTRREYNYASFNRSFKIDETIDSNSITATYEEGILLITLNKKEEAKENSPLFINID